MGLLTRTASAYGAALLDPVNLVSAFAAFGAASMIILVAGDSPGWMLLSVCFVVSYSIDAAHNLLTAGDRK